MINRSIYLFSQVLKGLPPIYTAIAALRSLISFVSFVIFSITKIAYLFSRRIGFNIEALDNGAIIRALYALQYFVEFGLIYVPKRVVFFFQVSLQCLYFHQDSRSTPKTHSNSFFQSSLVGFIQGIASRCRAVGYRQNCMAEYQKQPAN